MRSRRPATIVVAATATMLGLLTAPADAVPKPRPITTTQYLAIANQAVANDGRLTADQWAQLQTRPDLLAVVPTRAIPDYEMPGWAEASAVTTTTSNTGTTSGAAAALTTTYTRSVDRYIVYESGIWNTKVADYHFVTAWSYNGTQVIGTPSSYSYLANACGGCQNGGIVTNSQYRNYNSQGVYAWTVPLTGKWQWCSMICTYFYPQVKFGVYFDGTYHYTVLSTG